MYYKRNKNAEQISTTANNSSYAMRVSEVLQVPFPQARFVSIDTDVATQSRTAHSCDRYVGIMLLPLCTEKENLKMSMLIKPF
jgi:hypothetical protein